jgi:hypothetical protein
MQDALPVRKQFDISAASEPQLELRLRWFGHALEVRHGRIVDVQRRCRAPGEHVASIAYEVPLPPFEHPKRRQRSGRAARGGFPGRSHDEVASTAERDARSRGGWGLGREAPGGEDRHGPLLHSVRNR